DGGRFRPLLAIAIQIEKAKLDQLLSLLAANADGSHPEPELLAPPGQNPPSTFSESRRGIRREKAVGYMAEACRSTRTPRCARSMPPIATRRPYFVSDPAR